MTRQYKGSFTIETAMLLPIISLVFVLCVWGSFYFHDKNILSSCAYEIAVVGSTKIREKDSVTEEQLCAALTEQLERKCILFSNINVTVQIGEEKVVVEADASRRKMKATTKHVAAVTEPEAYIRKVRKLQ